jgi:hypothetical protein
MNKFEIELNFVKQVQLRSFFCFNTVWRLHGRL